LQTLETTRRLGELDRAHILKVLEKFFARRAVGDVEGVLELVAPEIVFFANESWRYGYPRRIVGKEALREMLRQRHVNYVVLDSIVRRMLIDGHQAAVHSSIALRGRGGGDAHEFDCIEFLSFRDGLILEFDALPDGSAREVVVNFPY
jgi:ketosteroid isomerase-like protein